MTKKDEPARSAERRAEGDEEALKIAVADRRGDMAKVLTVADLIRVLADQPSDLPIYLADWNEEWADDWPLVKEEICVLEQRAVHDRIGRLLFNQPRRLCLGKSTKP